MIAILIACALIICLGYRAEPAESRAGPSKVIRGNREKRLWEGLGDPASSSERICLAPKARFHLSLGRRPRNW